MLEAAVSKSSGMAFCSCRSLNGERTSGVTKGCVYWPRKPIVSWNSAHQRKKRKKNYASSKKLLTAIKEKEILTINQRPGWSIAQSSKSSQRKPQGSLAFALTARTIQLDRCSQHDNLKEHEPLEVHA